MDVEFSAERSEAVIVASGRSKTLRFMRRKPPPAQSVEVEAKEVVQRGLLEQPPSENVDIVVEPRDACAGHGGRCVLKRSKREPSPCAWLEEVDIQCPICKKDVSKPWHARIDQE